jgi:hypothetical protein
MDTMPPTTSHKKLYLVIAAILFLVVVLAILLHLFVIKPHIMKRSDSNEPFYDTQNAMVIGKILSVGDNTITFENKKGIKKELPLSKTLTIITLDEKGLTTTSTDLKKIETGKILSLNLAGGENGNLEVTVIMPDVSSIPPGEVAPPPPPPSLAPVATPSASTRTSPRPTPTAVDNDSEN